MRTSKRGKAALAAIMTVGLALVASPAAAADPDPAFKLEIADTSFQSGMWGAGIEFELSEVPGTVSEVTVIVGSMGSMGGGAIGSMAVELINGDGTASGTLEPNGSPVMPNAEGYPKYSVSAHYTTGSGDTIEYFNSNVIELTITEGLVVTGPEEVTPSEFAAGVPLSLSGFNADESITAITSSFDPKDVVTTEISSQPITAGPDGTATFTSTVADATVGYIYTIRFEGELGTVNQYVRVVEEAPVTPKKPESIETAAA